MITIAITNTYFDGTDYNNSVKYYVDDRFYYFLDPGSMK